MKKTVLTPKDILRHLCESEEKLWTQRYTSEGLSNTELGSTILSECKCLKKIYDHFSGLEKRKCCLSLTVCRTTFSNFRVVRSDGRDIGIEEGAMIKTPSDTILFVPELNEKEFRVFRYAYMCATFPVLGAPDPPSPHSPPLATKGSSRLQIKDGNSISKTKQFKKQNSMEDKTSVVPAETLLELLRMIFKLSHNTFYQYEVFIRNTYYNKYAEPNKILAEEMVGQLAALENNCNPYYKPTLFMTQFGYDRWQRKEFSHIAELMRKFWQVAHPQKRSNHIAFLQSVHEDYVTLMEIILRYESTYRHAESTKMTFLSSASIILLREFGLRYGIGESYRRIAYLRYLVAQFDHSVFFIQHCNSTVRGVLEILPTIEDMVRKEVDEFSESISKLQTIALSTLSKMKSIFTDKEAHTGINSLISLIETTLQAKVHLKLPKFEQLDDLIFHCIERIFPTSYNEMKIVAITDLKQDRNGNLTPSLLNMMIGKIRDEVQHCKTYYEGAFIRFCNVTAVAAQSLYTLLIDDIKQFFSIYELNPVTMNINKQLLGLGYRLRQLDEDWAMYVSGHPGSDIWRECFCKVSLHWMRILKLQLQQTVLTAVGSDKFKTQCFDDVGSAYQMSSTRDRTFSLKSITPSINSAFSGLTSSLSTPSYNNTKNSPVKESHFKNYNKVMTFVRQTSDEPDTRSLDGLNETNTISFNRVDNTNCLTLGSLRSCSSLPDTLSKSYDHYLKVSRKMLPLSQQSEDANIRNNKQFESSNSMPFEDQILWTKTVSRIPSQELVEHQERRQSAQLENTKCISDRNIDIEIEQSNSEHSDVSGYARSCGTLSPSTHSDDFKGDDMVRPISQEPVNSKTTGSFLSYVKKSAILPVSSSVLDVIVMLQRLMEFWETLCHTFLQRTCKNSCQSPTEDMLQLMFNSCAEILQSMTCLYADNIVCLDLCGTSREQAIRLAGEKLMEHLQRQRDQCLIWGCRHNVNREKDCFRFLNSTAELLCDRYEYVTKDMCTRINNVYILLEYVEMCRSRTERDFRILEEAKQSPSTTGRGENWRKTVDVDHISGVIRAQCRIMAYRINLFVNDAVVVLLSLKKPSVSIDICLIPLTQFLQSYIDSLNQWLYNSCYKQVMKYLWIFMVQNFNNQLFEVLRGVRDYMEHAQLLLQTFTEDVMFKLELCSTSTNQLITLYKAVKEYVCNYDFYDFTQPLILCKMREDLLKSRKCFSGSHLVKWIFENAALIDQLGLPIGWNEMTREVAVVIGQKLLECHLILDTGYKYEHDMVLNLDIEGSCDLSPEEYPNLSIMEPDSKTVLNVTSDHDNRGTTTASMKQKLDKHVRNISSPLQHSGGKHASQSVDRLYNFPYTSETPMSFSSLFINSEGPVFENCESHYYYLTSVPSMHCGNKEDGLSELSTIVDKCFQKRISHEFLFHIIYSRRTFDFSAKSFVHSQSLPISNKLSGGLQKNHRVK